MKGNGKAQQAVTTALASAALFIRRPRRAG